MLAFTRGSPEQELGNAPLRWTCCPQVPISTRPWIILSCQHPGPVKAVSFWTLDFDIVLGLVWRAGHGTWNITLVFIFFLQSTKGGSPRFGKVQLFILFLIAGFYNNVSQFLQQRRFSPISSQILVINQAPCTWLTSAETQTDGFPFDFGSQRAPCSNLSGIDFFFE